ncbi:MAG: DMT family transporter [Gammaproteobacteria bacterium]|nr:DMT family transporter [Gammaproteobacteria bacterium]MDD9874193.1 DMT family transporter [Gammaproteobacteria bacterium]
MPNALSMTPGAASKRRAAMLFIVCCAVIISFDGPMIRSMDAALPWQVNFYRSIALLGFVGIAIVLRFGRASLAAISGIGVRGCIAGALFGFSTMAFVQSMVLTTVANTLFILGTIPFLTALMARLLLKEKLGTATVLTMAVAAAGLTVMVLENLAVGGGAGSALALVSAACFALYAVLLRGSRHKEMLPVLLISALVIIVVAALVKAGDLRISTHDLILCLIWGGLLTGTAHWLFILSSRHLAAAEVTLFLLLELALGPILVWLMIGEQPSGWTLAGGVLIVSAVAGRAALELAGGVNRRPRP